MSVVMAACGIADRTRSECRDTSRLDTERRIALEHPVGSGLQWHVQSGADVGRLRHRLDDVVGEFGRVRRVRPDPFQTLDAAALAQQRMRRLRGPGVSGSAKDTP